MLRVAIVGRPNVGKSTLFNRLVGRRSALVHPTPGVTRDRREGEARIGSLEFAVFDTAGLEEAVGDGIARAMQDQTERALGDADVVLMLIDARAGVTPVDQHFAALLRKSSKPVVLVANKCEGRGGDAGLLESFELGLGDPVAISAEHGEGMGGIEMALEPFAEAAAAEAAHDRGGAPLGEAGEEGEEDEHKALQLAIVGRPNVGKSTLVNRLLGEERVITGPQPGVTRDAISIEWEWKGRPVRLIDTAGMRRKARVTEKLEWLSVADTTRAIRYAHVVVIMVDADAPMEKQDLTIAREVVEEGRAVVLAVNKWDMIKDKTAAMRAVTDRLQTSLPQVRGIPVVTFSALTGRGVERLLPAVFKAYDVWNRRVPTGPLNRWFGDMLERHPPPAVQGRRLRLRYITQIKARPPTFALFSTRPAQIPESYLRYIANGLREDFDLPGVPIRLVLRKGANPYVDEGRGG